MDEIIKKDDLPVDRQSEEAYLSIRGYVIDAQKQVDVYKRQGLGLALSKEIVEAHGGTIKARSKYGKGSIFIVTIPIYFEEEEDNKNGR